MDAIATATEDRQDFHLPELPLARGSRCRSPEILSFCPVSNAVMEMEEFHRRLQSRRKQPKYSANQPYPGPTGICRCAILPHVHVHAEHGLSAGLRRIAQSRLRGNLFCGRIRRNSGIYIRDLGKDILLRSVAIAYVARTRSSPPHGKKLPGSFSQAVRVGDWLLIAGQDAVEFQREVLAEGDLAGQTESRWDTRAPSSRKPGEPWPTW